MALRKEHLDEIFVIFNYDPNHNDNKSRQRAPPYSPLYLGKRGVTRVFIMFSYFYLKNVGCGYPLEPPHWGGSNEHQTTYVSSENKENITYDKLKNSMPAAMKANFLMHEYVILMHRSDCSLEPPYGGGSDEYQ